ncbi:MAG: FAD-dependent oxidoreductase, partial [bacterium]
PWGDAVLRLAGRAGSAVLRPTKGVHLVYGEALVRHALILRARKDGRVFFVLPWQGLTLLGTTDTEYAGDPGAVAVEDGEARYLIEETAAALPGARLDPAKVLSSFAGVRPLLAGPPGHPSAASREHAIREDVPGL